MTRTASSGRRRRVGMINLGCPKNRVDAEVILGRLVAAGYELTSDLDGGGDRDRQHLRLHRRGQAGVDRHHPRGGRQERGRRGARAAGRRLHGAAVRSGAARGDPRDRRLPLARRPAPRRRAGRSRRRAAAAARPLAGAVRSHRPAPAHDPGYAYLKVAEGCNNPCTFCAIPLWRGRFRSRTIESLVEEARQLEATGVQELCLVAQDTTRYGEDLGLGRHGLLRLVEALLAGHRRALGALALRLSDHPRSRAAAADGQRGAGLPLPRHPAPAQPSARSCGRCAAPATASATSRCSIRRAPRLRTSGCAARSSSASRARPRSTSSTWSSFLERAALDHVGAFTYSGEDGTPAAEMGERPAPAVARERQARLLERQRPIALARRRALVGQRLEVLVEGVCDESEHLLSGPSPRHGARDRRPAADRRRRRAGRHPGRGRDRRRLRRRPGGHIVATRTRARTASGSAVARRPAEP